MTAVSTSALPGTTILNLPIAIAVDGSEQVPLVQGNTTKRAQLGQISNFYGAAASFILASSAPPGFALARTLTAQSGVTQLTDGGPGLTMTIGIGTNGIGPAQFRQSSGISVVGNPSTATANVVDLPGTTDQVLRVNQLGSSAGFGQINLASSNAVTNQLSVPNGGTGSASFTPFTVILAGTTTTGPFQTVITTGLNGQVLTSGGAGVAPSFQNATGTGTVNSGSSNTLAFFATNGTAVSGSSNTQLVNGKLTLGNAGANTVGQIGFVSTSANITTITPSTTATTLTLPNVTTTIVGSCTADTLFNKTITGAQINATSSFGLRTTGAAFDLIVGSTEALSASRNLNVRVGDANRNLVLAGDFTVASSFAVSITSTAASSLAVPVSGTLATLAGIEVFTNHTYDTNLNTFRVNGTAVVTESDMLNTITSSRGAILYNQSSGTWVGLTAGTSTQVLMGGNPPSWGAVGAGTVSNIAVTGILTSTNAGATITSSGTIFVNASITPQGRLTLATATPVMTTSVTGSSIIFYTPYMGNLCPIFDGTSLIPSSFAELSQNSTDIAKSPSAAAASTLYDMFVWNDSGTIRCTRGSSWNTTTVRASSGGLTRTNGILLNTTSITNGPAALRGTYVGTIVTNASTTFDFILGSSASGGGAASLGVWNYYNRVSVTPNVSDNGGAYSYTSATTRNARGGNTNIITFVSGLAEEGIEYSYTQRIDTGGSVAAFGIFGVSLDSSNTINTPYVMVYNGGASNIGAASASGNFAPQIGLHTLWGNESGNGSFTVNFDSFVSGSFTGSATLTARIRA